MMSGLILKKMHITSAIVLADSKARASLLTCHIALDIKIKNPLRAVNTLMRKGMGHTAVPLL